MRILWLAAELRAAGLTVIEHEGWLTRGWEPWGPVCGIMHATAAPRTQADTVQVQIVRDGREGLQGPIANACVDRGGRWHVLASGRCNTTILGTAGPYAGVGNIGCLGIEACNDNLTEPWAPVQYDSYVKGWARIARRMGWDATRLRGHKEHTPGHKTDPTFDMDQFRSHVNTTLKGSGGMATMDDVIRYEVRPWTGATLTKVEQLLLDVARLQAAAQAEEIRDRAVLAAVTALAEAGSVDPAPIVAAINAVRDEEVTRLRADLLEAEAVERRLLRQFADMLVLGAPREVTPDVEQVPVR